MKNINFDTNNDGDGDGEVTLHPLSRPLIP
jgi:hypothetical protein